MDENTKTSETTEVVEKDYNAPIVSIYIDSNDESNLATDETELNYGSVKKGTSSDTHTFYIWNNRNGEKDTPKMQFCTFTTLDRYDGFGDTPGAEVPAVRDNWFNVQCDSYNQTEFTPVGKGIESTSTTAGMSGIKKVGTLGMTINVGAANATTWTSNVELTEGSCVLPTVDNNLIYTVLKAGTTGDTEPAWETAVDDKISSGTVDFAADYKNTYPELQEVLGMRNSVLADGSNADVAAGNFVKLSVKIDVPLDAEIGEQKLKQRFSFSYV